MSRISKPKRIRRGAAEIARLELAKRLWAKTNKAVADLVNGKHGTATQEERNKQAFDLQERTREAIRRLYRTGKLVALIAVSLGLIGCGDPLAGSNWTGDVGPEQQRFYRNAQGCRSASHGYGYDWPGNYDVAQFKTCMASYGWRMNQ